MFIVAIVCGRDCGVRGRCSLGLAGRGGLIFAWLFLKQWLSVCAFSLDRSWLGSL